MQKILLAFPATLLLTIGVLSSESRGQFGSNQIQQLQDAVPGVRYFKAGETVRAVYGTRLSSGRSPLQSAENYLARWEQLFAENVGELTPVVNSGGQVLQAVMPDPQTGAPRFHTFRFQQSYAGLPLFRKGVGFLTRNEPGHPLVLSGFDLVELQGVELEVPSGAAFVSPEAEARVLEFLDSEAEPGPLQQMLLEYSEEEYVLWAGASGESSTPRLAVAFIGTRGSVQTHPFYERFRFVAAADTGEVLLAESLIHNVTMPFTDVNGTVQGEGTDGIRSADCDPESTFSLPWAEVAILGGNSSFADASGAFTIPHGGTAAVTVRSFLGGQFFDVFDQAAGNSIPQIDLLVTPPGPASFLHNPAITEFPTSNVNVYLGANLIRDWVLSYEPSFPVIDTQTNFTCNTNIASTCNAFYDGVSINFYRSGGGCPNTGMSDVIYHEYGHHLINVTGNGQGQLGEGTGDSVAVLIQDDPILAAGWNVGVCNAGLRTANNSHQYPCTGAIHDCGNLISGCVWDTRNALIVTEPANYRDINAALFLGMLIVRGQQLPGDGTIDPFITILYLTLDDDDANIGNGTPHYNEIAAGFGAHGMDAPPLDFLQFDYPSGRPALVDPTGAVEFTVAVSSLIEDPVDGTGVLHVDRGSGFEMFPMNEISPSVYEAEFPPTTCGTEIRYYVSAETNTARIETNPKSAPASVYVALSGSSVTTTFLDDFETNTGWSVSGTATDGQWQRGTPAGGGVRGDPAADGDGSGQCYVTDNVPGNSDVDGGNTVLTSPILDASGAGEQVVSYYRWFSNDFGNAPFEDPFLVEISNNGGSTWTVLEIVGPTGPEVSGGWFQKSFLVSDFVAPTSQMRLRFTAEDEINGSVVEAGVDGVRIESVECDDCATNPPQWASVGPALAGTHGDPVLAGTGCLEPGKTVTLSVTNALESTSFALITGLSQLNAPFLGGTLVPSPTLFLLGLSTNSQGDWTLASVVPSNAPSGVDLYLQAWIIDPVGPRGFAATNGITASAP